MIDAVRTLSSFRRAISPKALPAPASREEHVHTHVHVVRYIHVHVHKYAFTESGSLYLNLIYSFLL